MWSLLKETGDHPGNIFPMTFAFLHHRRFFFWCIFLCDDNENGKQTSKQKKNHGYWHWKKNEEMHKNFSLVLIFFLFCFVLFCFSFYVPSGLSSSFRGAKYSNRVHRGDDKGSATAVVKRSERKTSALIQ